MLVSLLLAFILPTEDASPKPCDIYTVDYLPIPPVGGLPKPSGSIPLGSLKGEFDRASTRPI